MWEPKGNYIQSGEHDNSVEAAYICDTFNELLAIKTQCILAKPNIKICSVI